MAPNSQIAHRVLVVDNEDEVRAVMTKALELKGFEVVAAANLPDALRHIVAEGLDVLITDLQVPNPNGGLAVVIAMRHSHARCANDACQRLPRCAKRPGRRLPGSERNHRRTIREWAACRAGGRQNNPSDTCEKVGQEESGRCLAKVLYQCRRRLVGAS
jgi:CheY-like chemotaxis protein